MQARSFIEILAQELRKEIRAEVEAEFAMSARVAAESVTPVASAHKADQVGLWLSLKLGNQKTGNQSVRQSANPYKPTNSQRPTVNSKVTEPVKVEVERAGKVTSIEQALALEFFKREGSKLSETFVESELKTEFRKVAMKIHPDRHANATAEQLRDFSTRFQTLVESAEILESALT